MAYSSGVFSLVAGNPVVTGTTVSSTWANNTLVDIATGLTTALLKDGTQTATASVDFAQGITVATSKFTVDSATGNTVGGGTLKVATGAAVGGATPGTGGLAFPAVQVAITDPNTLDDYEEGTWTPNIGGTTPTYTTQTGFYTKIGNLVLISGELVINSIGNGSANQISGLPFTSTTGNISGVYCALFSGLTVNVITLAFSIGTASAVMTARGLAAAAAASTVPSVIGSGTDINFFGFYYTA